MEKTIKILTSLILKALGVCKEQINLKGLIEAEFEKLYILSKVHDISHILGYSLAENKEIDKKYYDKFNKDLMIASCRYEQIEYEQVSIMKTLSEGEILHVPLKGTVIRGYYNKPFLRNSCDIDILVKKEDLKKAIKLLVDKLGYTHENTKSHDAHLWSPSGVLLELHYDLIEETLDEKSSVILKDAFSYVVKKDDSKKTVSFTDEFFIFYHFAHMAKHFAGGGCGIKPFIDLYVLKYRAGLDFSVALNLIEKAGLKEFVEESLNLVDVWFNGKEHSEISKSMEEFVVNGGVYGTLENSAKAGKAKKGGKKGYLIYRIFMPYKELCCRYPSLKGRKILYPIYAIARWFSLLNRKRLKRSIKEVKYLKKEDSTKTFELMQKLNLIKNR